MAKILIFGLPGSGKSWLAQRLQPHLDAAWFNGDEVRRQANDWDFTAGARIRQARRMRSLANFEKGEGRTVICDFVCPTELTRYIFEADFTIWMNTISAGRFEDTNALFERPKQFDIVLDRFIEEAEVDLVVNSIAGVHV
jgi:adenylylsulfate kinase